MTDHSTSDITNITFFESQLGQMSQTGCANFESMMLKMSANIESQVNWDSIQTVQMGLKL